MEKIRDYLNGKMKAIDTNFFEVNTKVHTITRQVDILERTVDSQKEDIECLDSTLNETKLNVAGIIEKAPKNNRLKKSTNEQSNIQGEASEEHKQNAVEERIMDLLDEMERLKSEYNELLFGKPELSDDNSSEKQLDPEIV